MDDPATTDIAIGSSLGIVATKKLPRRRLQLPLARLIWIHEDSRKKNDARIGPAEDRQKLTQDVLNALARSSYD